MTSFYYLLPTELIPFVGPLCMELYATCLCSSRGPFQRTWFYPHDTLRLDPVFDHTGWLAKPALSPRWWHAGTPSLETGEVVFSLADVPLILKKNQGVVWLALGSVAEVLPLVSPATLFDPPLLFISCLRRRYSSCGI